MTDLARRSQPLLGTFVEISVPRSHADALDGAFAAIAAVHSAMSFHEADSDIGRINRAATGEVIECDPQTVEVLRTARLLFDDSDGLFDICVAPRLVRDGYLPADPKCPVARSSGNCGDVEIVDERAVRLHKSVMIDLGGIAKGYGVDRAIDFLKQAGVPSAMVNAGGDLRCYGDDPWPVQLRNADGSLGQAISLSNSAIASSANRLTRKRKLTGMVTPHIGANGRPVRIDKTISVVAQQCVWADAMTKIAMADLALAGKLLAPDGGYVLDAAAIAQNAVQSAKASK